MQRALQLLRTVNDIFSSIQRARDGRLEDKDSSKRSGAYRIHHVTATRDLPDRGALRGLVPTSSLSVNRTIHSRIITILLSMYTSASSNQKLNH